VILKQFYQLDQMIVPIIDKFPHAYLYTILGQTYASQSKNEEAKKYFMKALSLTKDEQIKKYIKQQLQAVL
jgi:tetratricopeptide (TPR) repeat protein